MLERDDYIVSCEQIDPDQEVTAWYHDLAGVGAHLRDYECPDELQDLVVE
jgi:hypothetical protein